MCPEQWQGDRLIAPACVAICPTGAAHIERPADPALRGAELRVIDQSRCIGCGSCARHCPYEHPLVYENKSHKCDLCIGRFDSPPCAEECPASALRTLDYWADVPGRPFPWAASGDSNPSAEGVGSDG